MGDLLILQGIEDGREDRPDGAGWSVSVNVDGGILVASAVIDGAAVLLMGACESTERSNNLVRMAPGSFT